MAKDLIHQAVKNALIKDGWIILADPFRIEYAEFALSADLAAERPFAAEREGQKIVVEVKSFIGHSFVKQLQYALGQYEMYLDFLSLTAPEYSLYLGVSSLVYVNHFGQKAVQLIIEKHHLRLLVVNLEQEEVVSWI